MTQTRSLQYRLRPLIDAADAPRYACTVDAPLSIIGLPGLHAPLDDQVERTGGVDHGRWTLLGRPTYHRPGTIICYGRPTATGEERQRAT